MLQHVVMFVSRSEGSRKVFSCAECCMSCYTAVVARQQGGETSAGSDQIQWCNIGKALGKMKTGWGGGQGNSVMREVKGHRCSKKQMLDVSHYTASPADQDIIFIQPEVPFMLIGATERRKRRRWRWVG